MANSKLTVKLNRGNVGKAILKGEGTAALLKSVGDSVAGKAAASGGTFECEVLTGGKNRIRAVVSAADREARELQARDKVLERALNS